jgi:hypothetical protein
MLASERNNKMKIKITDDEVLAAAKTKHGSSIQVYDDGFGNIYISRDSMGIVGIVRARTWEDAYGICQDEFFPEADETMDEIIKEYGFKHENVRIIHPVTVKDGIAYVNGNEEREATTKDYELNHGVLFQGQFVRWETKETADPEAWMDNALFQEAFGFRPNGPNSKDKLMHGIYAKDLNGDSLELLTSKLAEDLGITLTIKNLEYI